jgi:hypothetical protein
MTCLKPTIDATVRIPVTCTEYLKGFASVLQQVSPSAEATYWSLIPRLDHGGVWTVRVCMENTSLIHAVVHPFLHYEVFNL